MCNFHLLIGSNLESTTHQTPNRGRKARKSRPIRTSSLRRSNLTYRADCSHLLVNSGRASLRRRRPHYDHIVGLHFFFPHGRDTADAINDGRPGVGILEPVLHFVWLQDSPGNRR